MKKLFGPFMVMIILLAALGGMSVKMRAGAGISATLTADPASYTGTCPHKIRFTGSIQVSEPCTVRYQIVSNVLEFAPIMSLDCPRAGAYTFTKEVAFSTSRSGWAAIKIISPEQVMSNRALFTVTCIPRPVIDLSRTGYPLVFDGKLYIDGRNFGTSQGTRNVSLDGQAALPRPGWTLVQWTDQRIIISTRICDLVLWNHTYEIAITEAGQVISNIVSLKFSYPLQASQGFDTPITPGYYVTCYVQNLPASPAGFVFNLVGPGTYTYADPGYNLSIVCWQGASDCVPGTIVARLPMSLPPGHYMLNLRKDGVWCTYDDSMAQVLVVQPPI